MDAFRPGMLLALRILTGVQPSLELHRIAVAAFHRPDAHSPPCKPIADTGLVVNHAHCPYQF